MPIQCPALVASICYFTGPFFLVLAGAALLYGIGGLPLGAKGWSDPVRGFLMAAGTLLRARMDPRPVSTLVKQFLTV